MFKKIVPTIKAQDEEVEEEELVDPQDVLKASCREDSHAQELFAKYEECNDRVNSRSRTSETCVEELTDFLHHVDHCVAKTLFSKLK